MIWMSPLLRLTLAIRGETEDAGAGSGDPGGDAAGGGAPTGSPPPTVGGDANTVEYLARVDWLSANYNLPAGFSFRDEVQNMIPVASYDLEKAEDEGRGAYRWIPPDGVSAAGAPAPEGEPAPVADADAPLTAASIQEAITSAVAASVQAVMETMAGGVRQGAANLPTLVGGEAPPGSLGSDPAQDGPVDLTDMNQVVNSSDKAFMKSFDQMLKGERDGLKAHLKEVADNHRIMQGSPTSVAG